MDSLYIIRTLKTTPYKFTFAHKVIDYLKKGDDNAEEIIDQLRRSLSDPDNADICKPIKEVVKYFKNYVM